MTKEKFDKYLEALNGISYLEWQKLQHVIERVFEKQRRELERSLQLSSSEEISMITRSLFG